MLRENIFANTVEQAVQWIIPYLEDTSSTAHKAIYFDVWRGLAASAVLRAIAEDPPPSLLKKFNKIIHVDCSRWKSRRAFQRTIAQELKLPKRVMDIFDRQDEEDDFRGVDEGSRAEIQDVAAEIYHTIRDHICLVVFHNGSDNTIDLNDFGIPLFAWFGNQNQVLWTLRGRLRLDPGISEKVNNSHLFLYDEYSTQGWNYLLRNEAREIAGYTDNLGEAAEECCLYLLSLNYQGGYIMDYNWATHASSYWVCDGIIQGGQTDEAWKVAAALHQQINMEGYSYNALPSFGHKLKTPWKRWILVKESSVVHPESTSFFLAAVASIFDAPLQPLPNDMFHQSDKLRVLKLFRCSFSFSAPPFHCCHSLRFLRLDSCEDQRVEEAQKQDIPAMEFFKSLWVLDICYTDWELDLSLEIIEQMSVNIREVHIKRARIWRLGFTWRKLQNLHKLRVIDPTSPWWRGEKDEFTDMVNLEFLDLSRDSTIQALPSMAGATCLKILVLDGCVGLERVGPEGLPLSLESFSLDSCTGRDRNEEAKISHLSLAGCARLVNFRLRGSLPSLEVLDLSGTLVKTLDLKDQMVQAPRLQQIILLGCLQLRAILWPEQGMPNLTVLHIDSLVCHVQAEFHQAYATIMDTRFLLTLVLESNDEFCWKSTRFHLNLSVPRTNKVEEQSYKEETAIIGSSGQILGPPRLKSLIPNTHITYTDVAVYNMTIAVDNMTIDHGYNSAPPFQPLGSHVEIGDGISFNGMESRQERKAILFVMKKAESLHAHDNASLITIISQREELTWQHLKSCQVERCPNMPTVFTTNYDIVCFHEIETFWATDLVMTHCIWSKGRTTLYEDTTSFAKMRSIYMCSCPRLTFVLPLWWFYTLRSLETLYIVNCGDLKEVFPVEPRFLEKIATTHRNSVLEFPNLKHIYLHALYKLQRICESKMFAPKLETIRIRGCWDLKRLPAVGRDSHPVVDCEKDWWDKLEWDGLEAGHDPSHYEPRHSRYYRKPLPRVSVLR